MKRQISAVFVIAITIIGLASAQRGEGPPKEYPLTVFDATGRLSMTSTLILSSVAIGVKGVSLRSETEMLACVDAYVASPTSDFSKAESADLQRFRQAITDIVSSLRLEKFAYMDLMPPIQVAKKDDGLVLIVGGIASTKVYNTIQMTDRQREVAALKEMILPHVDAVKALSGRPEIKYFGLSTVYLSKNFLDNSPTSTAAEALTFVMTISAATKFANGEITEDELVGGAEIYAYERGTYQVKRVKLTLQ
jgi:hypothetical protein